MLLLSVHIFDFFVDKRRGGVPRLAECDLNAGRGLSGGVVSRLRPHARLILLYRVLQVYKVRILMKTAFRISVSEDPYI
jgi:hypothetical protein